MTDSTSQDRPRWSGMAPLLVAVVVILAILAFLLWDQLGPSSAPPVETAVPTEPAAQSGTTVSAGDTLQASTVATTTQTGGETTLPLTVEGTGEVLL